MKYLLLGLLSLSIVWCSAQREQRELPPMEAMERMESKKVAYLTEELDLTVKEAQSFWPLYNEYSKKQRQLRADRRPPHQELPSTEEDAAKELQEMLDHERERLELQEEYTDRFQEVLPPSKVLRFFHLERQFVQKVLREFRNRRGQHERARD